MIRNRALIRSTAVVVTVAMLALAMPAWAFAPTWKDKQGDEGAGKKSKSLSPAQMSKLKGKLGENPYVSGTQRHSVSMWGVDLLTMNFTTAATDLSFEGGYGIPVNVTRTYSANEGDEGPFGKGWILSTDIRTTAGGLLKSDNGGDRSTPVHIKQFPFDQKASDGSFANTERIAVTDASGRETDSKLDVDGILSGPLWDKNVYDSVYEDIVQDEKVFSILSSMTVTTPEGTVYVYNKQGQYVGDGMTAVGWDGTSSTPQDTPSNILKISTITDRHGNQTSFTYSTSTSDEAYYRKVNGVAKEHCLTQISMPGGRTISFTWTTLATDVSGGLVRVKRISAVSDGTRTVNYGYATTDFNYCVDDVESPGDKMTYYEYENAHAIEAWTTAFGGDWTAGTLLSKITDCRGLYTAIDYAMGTPPIPMLETNPEIPTACAYRVHNSNNQTLYVWNVGFSDYKPDGSTSNDWDDYPSSWDNPEAYMDAAFEVRLGSTASGTRIDRGALEMTRTETSEEQTFKVRMIDLDAQPNGSGPYEAYNPSWTKTYSLVTGDLQEEVSYIYPYHGGQIAEAAGLYDTGISGYQSVAVETTYNFLGNPLEKTITESTAGSAKTVSYAYHGYDKYFQQKAVKDPAGRFSYTEYFDRDATDGKKGQVYRVYDPKWSNGFSNTGSGWKNAIVPSNTALWSAEFDYDTDGRPTSVKKLKSGTVGTSSTYDRVQTVTTYGGTGTPFWGAAATVTEDYGSGTHGSPAVAYLNRVTETLAYDVAGRAIETIDAAGKYWFTVYDADGRVQTVSTATSHTGYQSQQLSYTYGGSSPEIANGMPTLIQDKTTPRTIKQSIAYVESGNNGAGQVSSVTEQWMVGTAAIVTYVVSYGYNSLGLRDTVLYDSPNGDRKWHYTDYARVGSPESPNYAFQTLIEQTYANSTWSDSDEWFVYHYDTAGRLAKAAFAATRKTDLSGWENPPTFVAERRALQTNVYDAAGRVKSLEYTWQSSPYQASTPTRVAYTNETKIADGKVAYNYSSTTGLRTDQQFYDVVSGAWSLERTEYYGYDSNLDYLTSVDYNDGGAAEYRNWTYDAAGNRITDDAYSTGSWTYDNLNRMTASPKVHPFSGGATSCTYENDILGNRTTRNLLLGGDSGAAKYEWDKLNRLTKHANTQDGYACSYRADGQRIEKVTGISLAYYEDPNNESGYYDYNTQANRPTTRFFYDGQMGIEDDYNPAGTITVVNRYALGARGIDRVEHYESSTTTYGYPLYDGHGNMRATLARSGSSYSTGTVKVFDVWGGVRSGGDSTDPKQKYCANLGHVSDDESDLIYMRARYQEPATGRFISQDPAHDGWNWYAYCDNDPISGIDQSGKFTSWQEIRQFVIRQLAQIVFFFYAFFGGGGPGPLNPPTSLNDPTPNDIVRKLTEKERRGRGKRNQWESYIGDADIGDIASYIITMAMFAVIVPLLLKGLGAWGARISIASYAH